MIHRENYEKREFEFNHRICVVCRDVDSEKGWCADCMRCMDCVGQDCKRIDIRKSMLLTEVKE